MQYVGGQLLNQERLAITLAVKRKALSLPQAPINCQTAPNAFRIEQS